MYFLVFTNGVKFVRRVMWVVSEKNRFILLMGGGIGVLGELFGVVV